MGGAISSTDTFCDLGSGSGRLVIAFCLTTNAKRCIGVELSNQRHLQAAAALSRWQTNLVGMPSLVDRVNFLEGDWLKTDLSECTIFYACTTALDSALRNRTAAYITELASS